MAFQGEIGIRKDGLIPPDRSGDYYLANPPQQPKREIADYIESQGIIVPKRFTNLDDALASGRPFVVRSEHPQDYAGASGVFDSLFVSPAAIATCLTAYMGRSINCAEYYRIGSTFDKPDITGMLLARFPHMAQDELEESLSNLSVLQRREYCEYTNQPEETFAAQTSYSYWESIPGLNRTVVADSAIHGRYHIFTTTHPAPQGFPLEGGNSYFIIEDGEIIRGDSRDLPKPSEQDINSLVTTYNAIRGLDRFSFQHCPIIEMQSWNGKEYFLQYHRGVDFSPSEFELTRPKAEDELEAIMVRGATPPEGLNVNVGIHYGSATPDPSVRGALTWFPNKMFIEAHVRSKTLQLVKASGGNNFFTEDSGHSPRSLLLKPQISAVFESRVLSELSDAPDLRRTRENPIPVMQVSIVSDGRRAYLKRVA